MTDTNATSILSEAYRLAHLIEVTSDWDYAETESLFNSIIELNVENEVEFFGLIAARDALTLASESDVFIDVLWEGLGVEPEEFPRYLLKQEPEFYSLLQAKEAVSLLVRSSKPLEFTDRLIACKEISNTLQKLDLLGSEAVENLFSTVL